MTDGLHQINTKLLRQARALIPRYKYDLSAKQIIALRRLANDGADLDAVIEHLGWQDRNRSYVGRILAKRYGIHPKVGFGQLHRGDACTLPDGTTGKHDGRPWQPGTVMSKRQKNTLACRRYRLRRRLKEEQA